MRERHAIWNRVYLKPLDTVRGRHVTKGIVWSPNSLYIPVAIL